MDSRDEQFAKAVSHGGDADVLAFFRAYHAGVFRYMRCLTPSPEDAEDLAQDAMLQAKAKIRSFRGDSSLKTWVHRVAYHTFTHWQRRQKPQLPPRSHLPTQEDGWESTDARQMLRAALYEMSPILAQAFVLHEVVGFGVEEIAKVLEIPEGTVKSRLSSARQRLRELLTEPTPKEHHAQRR
jgi:RNA polymerase sigma-70 factor (ECF subfamily)